MIAVGLLMLFRSGPQPRGPTDAEIKALAENAHVVVGNTSLLVPFVALPDQLSMGAFFSLYGSAVIDARNDERNAFRAAALSPISPPILERITVSVDAYGWNDSNPDQWIKLCAQITVKWAQSVCDNPWSPLLQALPGNRFYLADSRKLEVFGDTTTVGGENLSVQIRSISLEQGAVSVACDRKKEGETQFCTATVAISKDLIGVWAVWEDEKESANRRALREGRAIAAFAKYALGDTEDFDALLAVVCSARRPGSGPTTIPGISPDPCIK